MAFTTLLDIARRNGSDLVTGLVDETTKAHPELTMGASRTITGINFKTLVRTGLGSPTTGSFRDANAGSAGLKNVYENRQFETYIAEPRWVCDKAVADRSEDGAQAYIFLEAQGIMEGEMQALCRQFYYGNSATGNGNAKGFPGLLDAYDSTSMVVDAGGTTASTGSSVWAVKFGPKNVTWLWGNNGQMKPSDVRVESIIDPADTATPPTKYFDGYVQTMLFYPGLQVASVRSIGRIKKLTEDSGKGLTDALLFNLLSKFEVGIVPDVFLMNRRSLYQLRASRTATNATGAPAPLPTDACGGIPIALTDAILNTESLTL